MKFVIDMNLSPHFCSTFEAEGWDSVHWSKVGAVNAPDCEIMQWARAQERIVLTHDLDFGALLAATQDAGPSVVQVRTQDVRPAILAPLLITNLKRFQTELESGALLIVDEVNSRIRWLPLAKKQ